MRGARRGKGTETRIRTRKVRGRFRLQASGAGERGREEVVGRERWRIILWGESSDVSEVERTTNDEQEKTRDRAGREEGRSQRQGKEQGTE